MKSNTCSTMYSNKLPIISIDNGSKIRNASLCNFYEVLKILGLLNCSARESMCWIRDYKYGHSISTLEQLELLLLNDKSRLRISFFSKHLDGLNDLLFQAQNGDLPIIDDKLPLFDNSIYVYTMWFDDEKVYEEPYLSKSGIRNVDVLFSQIRSVYNSSESSFVNIKQTDNLQGNYHSLKDTSNGLFWLL